MALTTIDLTQLANIARYRRPVLVWNGASNVATETGIDGVSGDAVVLFPDGQLRTETSTSRNTCALTQNAVFNNATLGSNQGGIRTGSVANNTWYWFYAVKVTTFAANWVLVADTVAPVQANYATLNSNFGTNGWVYLGVVPYGDNMAAGNAVPQFQMAGNMVAFYNTPSGTTRAALGVRLASATAATSTTWSYASGSSLSSNQVPVNLTFGHWNVGNSGTTDNVSTTNATAVVYYYEATSNSSTERINSVHLTALQGGLRTGTGGATANMDICLSGYVDGVLGVGSNPLL